MPGKIIVKGARVHNLKNIDVEIPRDQLVVITGVSGSGKSSLAFDTLYAEGQRRYVESLSADARQFLQQMDKPDVDSIDGLSPAIAIQPRAGIFNRRSTVGTVSEIYDFLRLLFARVGQPTCIECGREISAKTIEQIADELLSLPQGARILILAPIVSDRKGGHDEVLRGLAREGFARVKIDGRMYDLSETISLKKNQANRIDLVVDRLALSKDARRRLADSLEIASRFGRQVIKAEILSTDDSTPARELTFSQKAQCLECGISLPEILPSLFSFNSPRGACSACQGLGWHFNGRGVRSTGNENPEPVPCQQCGGARLRRESLAVKLGGRNIAQVASLPVAKALDYFDQLKLGEKQGIVGRKVISEIVTRLGFLVQVGLDYLSLDRSSLTLSGGEAQRVRLATQIGSSLAGTLYILDEPSIGLHQKDNAQLLALPKQLRDNGSSVIVVEHDRETILEADYIIDLGPGAGVKGGEVVARGTLKELMSDNGSVTARYLSGQAEIPVPSERRKGSGEFLVIKGARHNNIKGVTVEIPVGAMTCVTGVSGAGKSSLVMDILFREAARRLNRSRAKSAHFGELIGWEHVDRVVGIDQSPIGKTPRSNPATYIGLYDAVRNLFAQLPEARVRGYKPARFSFNNRGGRCEACAGDGITRVDMHFLPDVYVTCDACKGQRYNRETLEIKYKGLNIADVLDLTVHQASEILGNFPRVSEKLRMLGEVGLGYLRLGQAATTLSGGEGQRVKLAKELGRRATGKTLYILDEPTSGLHFCDIQMLLDVLHRLTDGGNTIVIVEHNLDVIKTADFIIDMGPEGGEKGGKVIAVGTPEEVARNQGSFTGQYLAKMIRV